MTAHLPAAKSELQQEESHAEKEADNYTPIIVQGEAPVVKDLQTDHALQNVVGETHFALEREAHQSVVQACPAGYKETIRHKKSRKAQGYFLFF